MPYKREYVICEAWNQCRGIDSAVLLTIEDQHGIVWHDAQISRDCYDSYAQFRAAIEQCKRALREEYGIESKTQARKWS